MNIKSKNIIQILALGLILVVLPGGAWYYLQMGLNYQKDARAELKDFETFNLEKHFKESFIDYDSIKSDEKIKLVCFWETEKQEELFSKLYDQFGTSGGMEFVIIQSGPEIRNLNGKYYRSYLNVSDEKMLALKNGFGEPTYTKNEKGNTIVEEVNKQVDFRNKDYPYFILMDFDNKIKNYYDTREEAQVNRMVEHIAILIPKTGRKSKK